MSYLQQIGIDPNTAKAIVQGKGNKTSPYTPLRNYQQDQALGINTESPYTYDPFESSMANKFQTEVSPNRDWEDLRAQRQSGLSKWGSAANRFMTKTAIYSAGGVLGTAWAPLEALFTWDIDKLGDNTLSRFADELVEDIDKHNPIYRTKAYENANLFKQMFGGSGNFVPEMLDTMAFVYGAVGAEVLSGLAISAATMGAGTMPMAVKAAGTIARFTNRFKKLSKAAELAQDAGDYARRVTALRKNASAIDYGVNTIRRIGTGSGFEASIEAMETRDTALNNLYEGFRLQNGRDPDSGEIAMLEQNADMAGRTAYFANIAALSISNALQMPRTFGLAKVDPRAGLGERIMRDVGVGKYAIKPVKNKALKIASIIGKNSLVEGGEEGIQSIISGISNDFAFNVAIDENRRSIGDIVLGVMNEKIQDKDFWHEVIAGSILGALGMPGFVAIKENIENKYKQKEEDKKAAANPNYKKKEFVTDLPWWSGGILGDILEDRYTNKKAKEAVDELNRRSTPDPTSGKKSFKDILSTFTQEKLAALAYSSGIAEDISQATDEEHIKTLQESEFFVESYMRLKYGLKEHMIEDYDALLDDMSKDTAETKGLTEEQVQKARDAYKSKLDNIETALIDVTTLSPNLDQMTKIKMAQELYLSRELGARRKQLFDVLQTILAESLTDDKGNKINLTETDLNNLRSFVDNETSLDNVNSQIAALEEAISEEESKALGKNRTPSDPLDSVSIDPEDIKTIDKLKKKLEALKAEKERLTKVKEEFKTEEGKSFTDILKTGAPEVKAKLEKALRSIKSVNSMFNRSKKIYEYLASNDQSYKDIIANILRALWSTEGSEFDQALFNVNTKKVVNNMAGEIAKEVTEAKTKAAEENKTPSPELESKLEQILELNQKLQKLVNDNLNEWRALANDQHSNHTEISKLKKVIDDAIANIVKQISEIRTAAYQNNIENEEDKLDKHLIVPLTDRLAVFANTVHNNVFSDVSFFYNSESVLKLFFPNDKSLNKPTGISSFTGAEYRVDQLTTDKIPADVSVEFPTARVRKYYEQIGISFHLGEQLLGAFLELESIVFDGDPEKNLKSVVVDRYPNYTNDDLMLIRSLNSRFVSLYKDSRGTVAYGLSEEGIRFVNNVIFINELRSKILGPNPPTLEELEEMIEFRTQFLYTTDVNTAVPVPYNVVDNAINIDGNRYPIIFDATDSRDAKDTSGRLFILVTDEEGIESWAEAPLYVINKVFGSNEAYEKFVEEQVNKKGLNTRYIGFTTKNTNTGGETEFAPVSLNYRKQYDPATGVIDNPHDRHVAEGFFQFLKALNDSNVDDAFIDPKAFAAHPTIYSGIVDITRSEAPFKFNDLTSKQRGYLLGLLNRHIFIATDKTPGYSYNLEFTLRNDKAEDGSKREGNSFAFGNIILSISTTTFVGGVARSENFVNLPNAVGNILGKDVNIAISGMIRNMNKEINREIQKGPNAGKLVKELTETDSTEGAEALESGMQYGDNIHNIYFTNPEFRTGAAHPSNYEIALGGKQEIKVTRRIDNTDTKSFIQKRAKASQKRFIKSLVENQKGIVQPSPGANYYIINGAKHERVTNVLANKLTLASQSDITAQEAEIEREKQEELNNVGTKQKELQFTKLREATSPEEQLNAINLIEINIAQGAIITKEEQREIQKIKDNLLADGYEVPNLLEKPFRQGMRIIVSNSVPDDTDTLAYGEEVITKVLIPQINKDNTMVQTAHVEVTVGTKKGGLSREQWLEERRKNKKTSVDRIDAKYAAKLAKLRAQQSAQPDTTVEEESDNAAVLGTVLHDIYNHVILGRKITDEKYKEFLSYMVDSGQGSAQDRLEGIIIDAIQLRARLQSDGFKIVNPQLLGSDVTEYTVHGTLRDGTLVAGKADILLERDGRYAILDFKSGDETPVMINGKLTDNLLKPNSYVKTLNTGHPDGNVENPSKLATYVAQATIYTKTVAQTYGVPMASYSIIAPILTDRRMNQKDPKIGRAEIGELLMVPVLSDELYPLITDAKFDPRTMLPIDQIRRFFKDELVDAVETNFVITPVSPADPRIPINKDLTENFTTADATPDAAKVQEGDDTGSPFNIDEDIYGPFSITPDYEEDELVSREELINNIRDLIPEDMISDQELETVISNIEANGLVGGVVMDGLLYLASKTVPGTEYHEVFHIVYRHLMSDMEVAEIIEAAKDQYGNPTDKQLKELADTYPSHYGKFNKKDLKAIWLEERLAEDFRLFMMKEKNEKGFRAAIKRLFRKLLKFLGLVKDPRIHAAFIRIKNGEFAKRKPSNLLIKNSPAFTVLKTRSRRGPNNPEVETILQPFIANKVISIIGRNATRIKLESNLDIRTAAFAAINEFKTNNAIEKWYEFIKTNISNPDKQRQAKNRVDSMISQIMIALNNKDNENTIVNEVLKLEKLFDYNKLEDNVEEGLTDDTVTVADGYDVGVDEINEDSYTRTAVNIGAEFSATSKLRRWLSTIPLQMDILNIGELADTVDYDNPIFNNYINAPAIYNYLVRLLSDLDSESMMIALTQIAKYDEEVKAVLNQLYLDITGNPYDPDVNLRTFGLKSNLFQMFITGFTNHTAYSQSVIVDTRSGNSRVFNSNSRDVDIEQVNEWAIAYKDNGLSYTERIEILSDIQRLFKFNHPAIVLDNTTDLFDYAIAIRDKFLKYGIKLSPIYIKWSILNRLLKVNRVDQTVYNGGQMGPIDKKYKASPEDIKFWLAYRNIAQDPIKILSGAKSSIFLLSYLETQAYNEAKSKESEGANPEESKPVGMFTSKLSVTEDDENRSIFFQLRKLGFNNAKFDKSVYSYSYKGLDGKDRYDKIKPNLVIEQLLNLKKPKAFEFIDLYAVDKQQAYESFSRVWGIYEMKVVKHSVDFLMHNPLIYNPKYREAWISEQLFLNLIDGSMNTMLSNDPIENESIKKSKEKLDENNELLNNYVAIYEIVTSLSNQLFTGDVVNIEVIDYFKKNPDVSFYDVIQKYLNLNSNEVIEAFTDEGAADIIYGNNTDVELTADNALVTMIDAIRALALNDNRLISLDFLGEASPEIALRVAKQSIDKYIEGLDHITNKLIQNYNQSLNQVEKDKHLAKIEENDEDDYSAYREAVDKRTEGTAWGKQDSRTKLLTMLFMYQQADHALEATDTRYIAPYVSTKNLEVTVKLPNVTIVDAKGNYTKEGEFFLYSIIYQEMDRVNRVSKMSPAEVEELRQMSAGKLQMNDLFHLRAKLKNYDRINKTSYYDRIMEISNSSYLFSQLISPAVSTSYDINNSVTTEVMGIMKKIMDERFNDFVKYLKSPRTEIIIRTDKSPDVDQSFLLPKAYRMNKGKDKTSVVNYNALKNDIMNMFVMSKFFNQTIRFDDALGGLSFVNLIRRGAGTIGSGPAVGMEGGLMRVAAIDDIVHTWTDNDFKIIDSNGNLVGPNHSGTRSEITDGQSFTNVWNYMTNYLYPLGKLTPVVRKIYTKILKGVSITDEESRILRQNLALAHPRKLLYDDPVMLIKTSVDILARNEVSYIDPTKEDLLNTLIDEVLALIEQLIVNDNNPDMQLSIRRQITEVYKRIHKENIYLPLPGQELKHELLNKMDINGIDFVGHKSAFKKLILGSMDNPTIISTKYLREQVVTDGIKDEITDGIQKLQLLISEQDPDKIVKFFNTETTMSNLIRGYLIAKDQRNKLGLNYKLNDILNPNGEINWEILMEEIKNNIEASNADGFILQMFQLSEGKPKFNLNASMLATKIEPILMSILSKGVLRHKTAGGKFSLSTSAYTRVVVDVDNNVIPPHVVKANPTKYKDYRTRRLAHNKFDPKTGEYYSECLLPAFIAEMFKLEEGEFIQLPPKLLKYIGYRIPTQSKSSMMNLRVVGILPAWRGNVIELPWESIPLSGEDFDIDAKYLTGYSWYKKDGVVKFYGDYVLADSVDKAKQQAYDEYVAYIEDHSVKYRVLHRARARELEIERGKLAHELYKYTKYLKELYEQVVIEENNKVTGPLVKSIDKQISAYNKVLNFVISDPMNPTASKKPDISQAIINAFRVKMMAFETEGSIDRDLSPMPLTKMYRKLANLKYELSTINNEIKLKVGIPLRWEDAMKSKVKSRFTLPSDELKTLGDMVVHNWRMMNNSGIEYTPENYKFITPTEASNFMLEAQFKFVINDKNVNASQSLTTLESPENMVNYMIDLKYAHLEESERERIRSSKNYSNILSLDFITDIVKTHDSVTTGSQNIGIFAVANIVNEYLSNNSVYKKFSFSRGGGNAFGYFNERNEQVSNDKHDYRINYLLSSYLSSATDDVKVQHSFILNLYSVVSPAMALMISDGWSDKDIMLFINNPLVDYFIKQTIKARSDIQNYYELKVRSAWKIKDDYRKLLLAYNSSEMYLEESEIDNDDLEFAIKDYYEREMTEDEIISNNINLTALETVFTYMQAADETRLFSNILSLIKGNKPTTDDNYMKFDESLKELKIVIDPYSGTAYWDTKTGEMPRSSLIDIVSLINNHDDIKSMLFVYFQMKKEVLVKILYNARPEFENIIEIIKDSVSRRDTSKDLRRVVRAYITYAQNMFFRSVTSQNNHLLKDITFDEMSNSLFTKEFTDTINELASLPVYRNNYLLRSLAVSKNGAEFQSSIILKNIRKRNTLKNKLRRKSIEDQGRRIFPITLDTTKAQKPLEIARLNTAFAELFAEYTTFNNILANLTAAKEAERPLYEMRANLLRKFLRGMIVHALAKDGMQFTSGTIVRAIWPEVLKPIFDATSMVAEDDPNNYSNPLLQGSSSVLGFNHNTLYEFLRYFIRDERNRYLPRELKALPPDQFFKIHTVSQGTTKHKVAFFSGLENGVFTETAAAAMSTNGFAPTVVNAANTKEVLGYKFPLFFRTGIDIFFLSGIRNRLSNLGLENFPAETTKLIGFEAEYTAINVFPTRTNNISMLGFTEKELDQLYGMYHTDISETSYLMKNLYSFLPRLGEIVIRNNITFNMEIIDNYFPILVATGEFIINESTGETEYGSMIIPGKTLDDVTKMTDNQINVIHLEYQMSKVRNANIKNYKVGRNIVINPTSNKSLTSNISVLTAQSDLSINIQHYRMYNDMDKAALLFSKPLIKLTPDLKLSEILDELETTINDSINSVFINVSYNLTDYNYDFTTYYQSVIKEILNRFPSITTVNIIGATVGDIAIYNYIKNDRSWRGILQVRPTADFKAYVKQGAIVNIKSYEDYMDRFSATIIYSGTVNTDQNEELKTYTLINDGIHFNDSVSEYASLIHSAKGGKVLVYPSRDKKAQKGNVEVLPSLTEEEMAKANTAYISAAIKLNRTPMDPASDTFSYEAILAKYKMVTDADKVIAIGTFTDGKPRMRSLSSYAIYGVQMAISETNNPVFVFDQIENQWYEYSREQKMFIAINKVPTITTKTAIFGEKIINEVGKSAIDKVYKRTIAIINGEVEDEITVREEGIMKVYNSTEIVNIVNSWSSIDFRIDLTPAIGKGSYFFNGATLAIEQNIGSEHLIYIESEGFENVITIGKNYQYIQLVTDPYVIRDLKLKHLNATIQKAQLGELVDFIERPNLESFSVDYNNNNC